MSIAFPYMSLLPELRQEVRERLPVSARNSLCQASMATATEETTLTLQYTWRNVLERGPTLRFIGSFVARALWQAGMIAQTEFVDVTATYPADFCFHGARGLIFIRVFINFSPHVEVVRFDGNFPTTIDICKFDRDEVVAMLCDPANRELLIRSGSR